MLVCQVDALRAYNSENNFLTGNIGLAAFAVTLLFYLSSLH